MDVSVGASCEALQAVERLYIHVKQNKEQIDDTVFQKCVDTLENLRSIKSSLEGSEVKVTAPEVSQSWLQELKQLTLMHVPSSLTDTVRENFTQLIKKSFQDEEVEIVFAALITCPWYGCTQKERGEHAKYNNLFIVYQSTLERFMAPHSAHLVEQTNVVDMNWMYACELYHFVQFIAKGRTRNVEALYCPQSAILFETEQWKQLRSRLHHSKVTGLRGFLEACRGQSVGGIGKKGKDGKFRMKDSTTFRELCDSFRLMHHAHNSVNNLPPCTEEFEDLNSTPEIAHKSLDILKSMYQNPDVSKKDAFVKLCEWKEEVDKHLTPKYNFTKPEEVHGIVGKWHMEMRLKGRTITPNTCVKDGISEMLGLLEEIGGQVAGLKPEQILMIARAGSYMYGLSTPTSDIDYVIIYAENTETYLTACKQLPEIIENRGPNKQVEYGAYEARCFAEMLLKGSVVILELVYKDDHNYMSPAWKALCQQKEKFISERAIQQYMGLIKNNIRMIKNEKHKNAPQERKLFYQIYHKLDSIEYMMKNVPPPVKCTGSTRDFIMRVRTASLEGDLDRDVLYKDCISKVDDIRDRLANRPTRLRENCDFEFIMDWIMTVRGISYRVT
ncbi:uncharacterized protein LOC123563823 [Mercenaria mercenaria]|uniref:uncharacterized protein LOC123563823 n=1 Tax=Mercenaria mercenaria TaxID=6596 RepID=UPI00234F7134|nr:uncharacterized protein LOC123563823 [Mercenaria mercenaria]XP_053392410.1 uncharacterized protein LOC123563823 [Mercenaria mercenaria]